MSESCDSSGGGGHPFISTYHLSLRTRMCDAGAVTNYKYAHNCFFSKATGLQNWLAIPTMRLLVCACLVLSLLGQSFAAIMHDDLKLKKGKIKETCLLDL